MKRFATLVFSLCLFAQTLLSSGEELSGKELPNEELCVMVTCATLDGKTETRTVPLTVEGNLQRLQIPQSEIPEGLKYIDIQHPWAVASVGEEGFYVLPSGFYGEFREREANGELTCRNCPMPTCGVKTPRGALVMVFTNSRYEMEPRVHLRNGQYTVLTRVWLKDVFLYDGIGIEYHVLAPNATYSDMAREYRKYQLDRHACVPLKERVQGRPELEYAARSLEVRVRLGWKPAPSPVDEQTAENEPPMKVAVTFERFAQIAEECRRQGIDTAEFCLVGWNTRGHDGRYPQIFPVEEALGGEAKLREAIAKAQALGYQVVAHTNNTDAYHASEIGGLWDENYLLRNAKGELVVGGHWSGGTMYETCPKCVYERFIQSDFAKMKALGFRGLHYIDVFSTVPPRTCWHPEHRLTKEDFTIWTNRLFADAQGTFGGLASEGGFDYCVEHLDYALYTSFYKPDSPLPKLADRHVPYWSLVYHGIVLSNPFSATVNYTLKSPFTRLKLMEYGGRPIFYFYSIFKSTGNNWMGDVDLTSGTDEELAASVRKMKEGYDEFAKLRHLQYEFLESHEQLAPDVFRSTFSDGTEIVCNYSDQPFTYRETRVEPLTYGVFRP